MEKIMRELYTNETKMVSGGCPLDLRSSGLSVAEAAELCAELNRTGELVRQIPSGSMRGGFRAGSLTRGTRIGVEPGSAGQPL